MKAFDQPYLPGGTVRTLPLGRYLPPLPAGMVTRWVYDSLPRGEWLLDPFGSTPALPLEAARSGCRVLVASNNPILTFLLETLAAAPQPSDFQAALAELGAARRGNERLEIHLQSLYASTCPACGLASQPEGFLWRRGETQPFARLMNCRHCGAEGEFPLIQLDLENLARLGSAALHRARAIERMAIGPEGDRAIVEEAVDSYLPRPLYVLSTLMNRVEGLAAPPERKRLLTALILSLLDEGSSLWSWPSGRSRPRQLIVSPQFKENNLWLALEKFIQDWCSSESAVAVTHWPTLPPESGGICIFPGRLRSLLPLPDAIHIGAAAGVLPRPNSAFWTFSALWTGWIWGREAALPLKSAFERRRYDWHWHATALYSIFSALNQNVPPSLPILGLLPEIVPGFLTAALVSSQSAGLELVSLALRSEAEPAQMIWKTGVAKSPKPFAGPQTLLRKGVEDHLLERGQPDFYLPLVAAGLVNLANQGGLPLNQTGVPGQLLDAVQPAMARILSDRTFLVRYNGGTQNPESGQWWLVQPEDAAEPAAERLEPVLVNLLQLNQRLDTASIEIAANRAFPGLLTPPADLLRASLEAVAEPDSGWPDMWRLRPGKTTPVEVINALLKRLAERLGYHVSGKNPLLWQAARGNPLYAFYPLSNAAATRAMLGELPLPAAQCVLVYPSSHSSLLQIHLQHDPRLSIAAASGWHFITIEILQHFAEEDPLTPASWEELLASDSARWREATQKQLF